MTIHKHSLLIVGAFFILASLFAAPSFAYISTDNNYHPSYVRTEDNPNPTVHKRWPSPRITKVEGYVYRPGCPPWAACMPTFVGAQGIPMELWGTGIGNAVPAKTDQNGHFEFDIWDMPAGVYNVCVKGYPDGLVRDHFDQVYSFPGEHRDPYGVQCVRVKIPDQNPLLRYFLKYK
jgi:hypothetical protein